MKWYLASRNRYILELQKIAKILKDNNHEISSDWIYIEENLKPFNEHTQRVNEIIERNVEALFEADVFLLFNDRGGRDTFTELGVCIAKNHIGKSTKIYIVGDHNDATMMQLIPDIKHFTKLEDVFRLEDISYNTENLNNINLKD